MKRITAYEIALSAISCAFATIFLTVGYYVSVLLFTGYLLGAAAIMIPLSEKRYLSAFLSYLGASILALLFTGFQIWDLLPFIVFFGLHPVVNALQLKIKINKWLAFIIKAVWFDVAMYLTWLFVFEANTSFAFVDKYIILFIAVLGTLFFFFYDVCIYRIQYGVNRLVKRIGRKNK